MARLRQTLGRKATSNSVDRNMVPSRDSSVSQGTTRCSVEKICARFGVGGTATAGSVPQQVFLAETAVCSKCARPRTLGG